MLLNKIAASATSVKKAIRSFHQDVQKDVDEVISHYKITKSTTPKPWTEAVKIVANFYNQGNISAASIQKDDLKSQEYFQSISFDGSDIEEGTW